MNDQYRHPSQRTKVVGIFLILLTGIAVLLLLHIGYGKLRLSPGEVLLALLNQSVDAEVRHIVWQLRLPRAIIAMTAGMMLGVAGAILQTILRNPLIEPGLIGASAGAVLLAVVWTLFAGGWIVSLVPLPLVALFGGMTAVMLVVALNTRHNASKARLVLIGAVVTAIMQSIISLLLLQQQQGLSSIFLWLFGSLNGKGWSSWATLWPWAVIGLLGAMAYARKADILQLGDLSATGLGLAVNRTRFVLLLLASVLTAASVSVVGAIGFIGLIGPHIAALLLGRRPLLSFPASGLLGGLLLLASDWIAQNSLLRIPFIGMEHYQASLPVGAVTTLLGAPFFLYLLRKSLVHKRK